ncbi:hypothetical protein MMC22_008071 [Lobaria immixta]|nr:hypothetical protein [Lobaria immixta]
MDRKIIVPDNPIWDIDIALSNPGHFHLEQAVRRPWDLDPLVEGDFKLDPRGEFEDVVNIEIPADIKGSYCVEAVGKSGVGKVDEAVHTVDGEDIT